MTNETLYLGANPLNASSAVVEGDYVTRDGESFYRIANVDGMDDFSSVLLVTPITGCSSRHAVDCLQVARIVTAHCSRITRKTRFKTILEIPVAERLLSPSRRAEEHFGNPSRVRMPVSTS